MEKENLNDLLSFAALSGWDHYKFIKVLHNNVQDEARKWSGSAFLANYFISNKT